MASDFNSVLFFLYNSITDLIFKVQKKVSYDNKVINISLDFHKSIYQSLVEKNLQKAEHQMVEHLIDVENRLHKLNEIDKIIKEELKIQFK